MTKKATYILAVSGGVDSVVMLDVIASNRPQALEGFEAGPWLEANLILAHLDHGIRADSRLDEVFVKKLADKYGLEVFSKRIELGPGASEETARKSRYEWLNEVCKQQRGKAVLTAHHQDDLIETAIINLLRGTYRRGLSSLKSRPRLQRPMLNVQKFTIENYAKKYKLAWREDKTNLDTKYLRNYIRLELIPKLEKRDKNWREKFLSHLQTGKHINDDIDPIIKSLAGKYLESQGDLKIRRQLLINLPHEIAKEILVEMMSGAEITPDSNLLKRVWLFAKTAKPGSKLDAAGHSFFEVDNQYLYLKPR